jgi:hypothetical protein
MKIRNGFVTNSSSSSFIVSTHDKSKAKVNMEVDLSEYSTKIKSLKELDQYFMENYAYPHTTEGFKKLLKENEYIANEYKDCKEKIKNGEKIYIGNISSEAFEGVEMLLNQKGIEETLDTSNLTVIRDERR